MDERIDELLATLTLEEKASIVAGIDLWHTPAVERAGVPALKVTDGPNGARGARWTGTTSVCFPCGSALGATWNPELVREVGEHLGEETRRRRAHLLLAPTVNLHRHPLAGRNFECHSEDPHLASRLAAAYVEGVQSRGVGCTVKHFVANDQEFERMTISSEVDERTLREVYLAPFEAAVDAGAWGVMSAYNRLRGVYCSEHPWLLTTVLREEWGFDGLVMSDWFGTHSTAAAANAGLDLEMPGPPQWFGAQLAAAVTTGEVDRARLDEMARRVLRTLARAGALDGRAPAGPEESVDDPSDREVVRRAATESFVLLRNDGTLPIPAAVKRIAVIGPNADVARILGGGSATVTPVHEITPLEGIRARVCETVEVVFERGCGAWKSTPVLDRRHLDGPLRVAYHDASDPAGPAALVETAARAYFTFLGPAAPGVPEDFTVEFTGTFVADEAGVWTFSLVQAGRARLYLDGELVCDNWNPTGRSDAFFGTGSEEVTAGVTFDAGERRALRVEFKPAAPGFGGVSVGCGPPEPEDALERAVEVARAADAVVCVVGTDNEWETEGNDRESLALPGAQDELVRRVTAANPRTAVVVNTASPVTMPWRADAGAVLQCWFPGQEWGHALADVLFGAVNPSGKLPTTFPERIEDTPAYTTYPGTDGQVRYEEGIFVGHRWYDAHGIEPAWCFGHGLSYTTFEIGPLALGATGTDEEQGLALTIPVTNTGPVAGAEVVQCYLHAPASAVTRPPQQLVGFDKVFVEPGATVEARIVLGWRSFATWDVEQHDWNVEPGTYELRVGVSSRDIRQVKSVDVGDVE
jgi:beta-glucosidase